ncbi:heavy metal-associated isoprenylated plant protein 16-like [Ananas comosus]|uniref:Heavy metal-associated isoprenylated plant protein 16-like n=1 Tax=Ananas comosus TaxID=4615 RepID=A0A6P5ED55_ANACO|nr:heavy metal-associated isoprenylated plant protein 16-like [Ananas comosus]
MATKQKIEMKIPMGHRNGQRKAMVIAAEKDGIDSIAVDGDKLVVTGVGVDLVKLVKSLRKKIGCTQIVAVSEVKKDKEEKPPTIPFCIRMSYSHLPARLYAYVDAPAPRYPAPSW